MDCRNGTRMSIILSMERSHLLKVWYAVGSILLTLPAGCGGAERFDAPWLARSSTVPAGKFGQLGSAKVIVVSKGDTLYSLARRYDIPVKLLIANNDLSPPYILLSGQTLRVPPARWHTVAAGESLSTVARRYGLNTESLAQENVLSLPYVVRVGQTLILPSGKKISAKEPSSRKVSAALSPNALPRQTAKASSSVAPNVTPKSSRADMAALSGAGRYQGGGFIWPIRGKIVGAFGPSGTGLRNDGINIAAPAGTSVQASDKGVVAYAGKGIKGFGNLILLKHNNGWMTAYAHNAEILVQRGDAVRRGQKIARVGATGNVSRPQLHFEIRKGSQALDPQKYLQRRVAKN